MTWRTIAIALIGATSISATPAFAGCVETSKLPAMERELEKRICPVSQFSASQALNVIAGADGEVDPDVLYLSEILHRLSGVHEAVQLDPQRLKKVLETNKDLRLGLQALVLSAVFREDEMNAWCNWRRDGFMPGERKDVRAVRAIQRAIRCGAQE